MKKKKKKIPKAPRGSNTRAIQRGLAMFRDEPVNVPFSYHRPRRENASEAKGLDPDLIKRIEKAREKRRKREIEEHKEAKRLKAIREIDRELAIVQKHIDHGLCSKNCKSSQRLKKLKEKTDKYYVSNKGRTS